jgi:aspartate aminotransferase-like enzyme
MEQMLQRMAPRLQHLCRTTRTVMIGTTSATGFMEMAARNGVRKRALSLVNGAFSERFAQMVTACGKDCVRLDVPLGAAVEPDLLRDALKKNPVDAVTLAHSETSTGVLQDLPALAAVVREFDDVLLLVDAVTSMAGSPVETDAWGLDFVFTGSQKALALPPGLAFGAASPRMLERAATTPALSLFFALDVQLERIEQSGGVEERWRRHEAMRGATERWAAATGVAYLPRADRRSWTVSCLTLPAGKSAKDVVAALKKDGWVIGAGYGALKDTTIRIGHMGDHSVAELEQLLPLVARAIR